jgi:hypothetical protein
MALANTPEKHCIMKIRNHKSRVPEPYLQWDPNGTDRYRIFGCFFNAKYNVITTKTVAILFGILIFTSIILFSVKN